jgi:hypothetical protein
MMPAVANNENSEAGSGGGSRELLMGQQTFRLWNVVEDHEQRHLASLVKRLGDFWWTALLGLLVWRVEDHEAVCDQLYPPTPSIPT